MERGLLSNRELASLLWLGSGAAWLLLRHRAATLSSCRDLLRALRPIAPYFLLYAAWIGAVSSIGAWLGLWSATLLKHTVLWAVLSGFGLLVGTTEAIKASGWFRRAVLATIGATAILEFFVNAKSFPLFIEVLLQPVIFLAIILPLVAREPEHQPVRSLALWVCALIGFMAFGWTLLAAIDQWGDLDYGQLLREAALPVWLTFGAIAFLYPFTLYMAYEQLLKRMRWRANGQPVWRQQLAVLAYAGPRLSAVRDLQGAADYDVVHAEGFRQAVHAIRQVRRQQQANREAERAAAQRLIDNAGLDGWDENGERLDQREFAETRKALHWLATCHMGHHRNHDRYRADLLPLVDAHFVRDGLPEDHGIVMKVADNGQAWYAYRETVSGWYFAIGASGPPPDQWCYDGPEPPPSFPDDDSWSRFGAGQFANHW